VATTTDTNNSSKRRRRLALLLALLLSATALGIGSSVLFFQHKSAGVASKKPAPTQNAGLAAGASSLNDSALNTPSDEAPTAQSQAAVVPRVRHAPIAQHRHPEANTFAEKALKDAPAAAGPEDLPPAESLAPGDVASNDPLQGLAPTDAGPGAPGTGDLPVTVPGFAPSLDPVGTDGKSPTTTTTITASVPEPSTWLMMLAGLCGMFAVRRRRS
jgi:hypothetical protein